MSIVAVPSNTNIIATDDFSGGYGGAELGRTILGDATLSKGQVILDGTGDGVGYRNVHFPKRFTFFAQIRDFTLNTTPSVFGGRLTPGSNGPLLRISSATSILFFVDEGAASVAWTVSSLPADFDIGLTYDDITNTAELWIDGVSQGTKSTAVNLNELRGTFQLGIRDNTLNPLQATIKHWFLAHGIYQDRDFERLTTSPSSLANFHKKAIAAYYFTDKIGEAAPFTTSDFSPYGNTATLGDGATATKFPTKIAKTNGYTFDGGDYIDCGTSPFSEVSATSMSIAIWLNLQLGDFDGVFQGLADTAGANTGTTNGFSMLIDDRGGVNPTNGILFSLHAETNDDDYGVVASNVIENGWNHLIMSYDASSTEMKAFVNGFDVGATTAGGATGSGNFVPRTDRNLLVGAVNTVPSNGFVGDIYSMLLFDQGVSSVQARYLFEQGPFYLGNY